MKNSADVKKEIEEEIEVLKTNIEENSAVIFDLERRLCVLKAKNQINLGKIYKLVDRYTTIIQEEK